MSDTASGSYSPPQTDLFQTGRLPMSEGELQMLARNRRMTRRIMVPLMTLMGTMGVAGGIWAMTTDTVGIGLGLTVAALVMLGLAWFYVSDTKEPIERPEKFFVTGVITSMRKTGTAITNVYYEIKLNSGKHKCYVSEQDFKRLHTGDIVLCERMEETSVFADRVVVVNRNAETAERSIVHRP